MADCRTWRPRRVPEARVKVELKGILAWAVRNGWTGRGMHPAGHEDDDAVELDRLEPLAGHRRQWQVGKRFEVQYVDQGARLTLNPRPHTRCGWHTGL